MRPTVAAGLRQLIEERDTARNALREIGERAVADWQEALVGFVNAGLGTADWDSVVPWTQERIHVAAARRERDQAREQLRLAHIDAANETARANDAQRDSELLDKLARAVEEYGDIRLIGGWTAPEAPPLVRIWHSTEERELAKIAPLRAAIAALEEP